MAAIDVIVRWTCAPAVRLPQLIVVRVSWQVLSEYTPVFAEVFIFPEEGRDWLVLNNATEVAVVAIATVNNIIIIAGFR